MSNYLSMIAGSFNIPKKLGTPGKDAHFVNTAEQVIGVADGFVGDCQPQDAWYCSRLLMQNVSDLVSEFHPSTSHGLKPILTEAYSRMNVRGTFTACLLSLTGDTLQAVNLGQSGFRVIRRGLGKILYKSTVQQRKFNGRLDHRKAEKQPRKTELMEITVRSGDVVILGTDGLFDNVFDEEIENVVEGCFDKGYGPDAMARALAMVAYQNSLSETKTSPFEVAAYEAGFKRQRSGGKPDDITVVAAYICA